MTKSIIMPHKIKIKAEKVSAGVLDTNSMKTAIEEGTVIGVGADVSLPIKVGDRIRYKSWGVDIFVHGDEVSHFIDERTLAICEKI